MKYLIFLSLILMIACSTKVKPRKEHLARLEMIKSMSKFFFLDEISDAKRDSLKSLFQLYYNDQLYRDAKNYDYYKANRKKQEALDKENQEIAGRFLDSAGFPSRREVGFMASHGVALTLVHAPIKFKEKYAHFMYDAVLKRDLMPSEYANFIDKLLTQKKQMQVYGSQVILYKGSKTLYPVNLATVDERRKEINMLETLEFYLKTNFKILLDSAAYNKELPALLNKYKVDTAANPQLILQSPAPYK